MLLPCHAPVVEAFRKDVSRMLEKLLGIEMDFAINDAVSWF